LLSSKSLVAGRTRYSTTMSTISTKHRGRVPMFDLARGMRPHFAETASRKRSELDGTTQTHISWRDTRRNEYSVPGALPALDSTRGRPWQRRSGRRAPTTANPHPRAHAGDGFEMRAVIRGTHPQVMTPNRPHSTGGKHRGCVSLISLSSPGRQRYYGDNRVG
jgi:hypothetical protein